MCNASVGSSLVGKLIGIAHSLAAVLALCSLAACGGSNGTSVGTLSTPTPTPTRSAGGGGTVDISPGFFCSTGQDCDSGYCVSGLCCSVSSCPAGQRCDMPGSEGICSQPNGIGAFCYRPGQCESGFCVNDACCAVATCAGGESCGVPGHEGHCSQLPTPLPTATATATRTPTLPPSFLRVTSTSGDAGSRVAIAVSLTTGSVLVAGTQNDLRFDGVNIRGAARADGSPDCAVEPAIHKGATAFAFLPSGCAGTACTGVRALVFAVDNLDPIADGSVLYRCNVEIAPETPNGVYTIAIENVVLSDPQGNAIRGVAGIDGLAFVGPPPIPSGVPAIVLGTGLATPGTQAVVSAILHTNGALVAASQNDIAFDVQAPIARRTDGKPDCRANPDIGKEATAFAFRPSGCVGSACTAIRTLVLSVENTDPIPDGSVLYTCTVNVAADAAGVYPLTISGVMLATPDGEAVLGATGVDGVIVVQASQPPTADPTATPTPAPSREV